MSYYMGDFYGRGSYYRGDPGFFSFLGNIAKKAVGFIPGVGPALSAGLESIIPSGASKIISSTAGVSAARRIGQMAGTATGTILRHPVLSAAGAAGAVGAMGAGRAILHHKGKPIPGLPGAVGHERKRRRMNVCNPRALRRSIRRTHGFAKLAMRTIHLVHPKKHARFGGFRRKKAR